MKRVTSVRSLSVWGVGVLIMLADTDAGNVVTAAQAGASWGYRLLPLLVVLTPLLYMVQELAVTLGIFAGRGYGELVRERFGRSCAWTSAVALVVATLGSLVTEFSGIAGIGELYGVPRAAALSAAAGVLLAVVSTGSYRRTEQAALAIGAFELLFFVTAWSAHPDPATIARHAFDLPLRNGAFLHLAAAVVGAVFNPWMIFYQQSAVVERGLSAADRDGERRDTLFGAVLTQTLTAAVLITMAAATGADAVHVPLNSIEQIADALHVLLGGTVARALFCMAVLGAAMVAAIVSSLALAWGLGEIAGYRRSLALRPFAARWFYCVYAAAVIGSALLVERVPNLVSLNIAAQVVNALLLPLIAGWLIMLAGGTALPAEQRLRGAYRVLLIAGVGIACSIGIAGALSMFL